MKNLYIAPSLLNHTSLLLPFATSRDKVSNLLTGIFMIASRLIAAEREDKMKEQLINCTSTLVAYKNDIKAD